MAHLGPTGPRWAPCWPHELFYLGRDWIKQIITTNIYTTYCYSQTVLQYTWILKAWIFVCFLLFLMVTHIPLNLRIERLYGEVWWQSIEACCSAREQISHCITHWTAVAEWLKWSIDIDTEHRLQREKIDLNLNELRQAMGSLKLSAFQSKTVIPNMHPITCPHWKAMGCLICVYFDGLVQERRNSSALALYIYSYDISRSESDQFNN